MKQKIGLALSGGGVLGAAHIGVLEELEAHNITISCLSGTSAGAIVGVLYAANGLTAVNQFLTKASDLFTAKRLTSISSPQKIFNWIESLLREYVPNNFNDLQIPFYTVATNFADGSKKVFLTGDPVACVMASSAYPGVFPMQEIEGNYYVDGGLTDNLPADILRKHGAEYIIGSSIFSMPPLEHSELKNMNRFKIASRALDILQSESIKQQIDECDFCFTPEVLNSYRWYQLNVITSIRDIGREYAKKQISEMII